MRIQSQYKHSRELLDYMYKDDLSYAIHVERSIKEQVRKKMTDHIIESGKVVTERHQDELGNYVIDTLVHVLSADDIIELIDLLRENVHPKLFEQIRTILNR